MTTNKTQPAFASLQGALARLLRQCPHSRKAVAEVLEWLEQFK
jgi:hypothetical protein